MHAATAEVCALPPLILHPFVDPTGPAKLLDGARVKLMLEGEAPAAADRRELERRFLDGRFCEIRMLYYIGKDVNRWIDQCLEVVARLPKLAGADLKRRTFADLLIDHTPASVQDKLGRWGVADYRAIFTRGLGLNAIFAEPPTRDLLTDNFIRDHYRFADAGFQWLLPEGPSSPDGIVFQFDLYASAEYTQLLEREWAPD